MTCMSGAPELTCVRSAIPAAERPAHFALARELLTECAQERRELPNGYAIRFPPEAVEAVARFIANERKCCPFLSFELTLAPESGACWLRRTGPDGAREAINAELNQTGLCGCG